jgi:hypothetical protein
VPQLQPCWQLSAQTAIVLIVLAVACSLLRRRWAARLAAFARDFAVVMTLLGLWQWVGGYVHTRVAGAMERGETIYRLQRRLCLPDEVALQHLVLSHPWLVRAANTYYGYAHLNGMAIFLVWIWWRHRDQYARARTVIILSTLACLLVQIVPVAPPRLLVGHGFVDTALQYGQSVYGEFGAGMANQLAAMPSVHVGWAVIVGLFVWRCAGPGWRWVGVAHAVTTTVVVVVTANHWWLDGVVAAGFVALAVPVGIRLDRLAARLRGLVARSPGLGASARPLPGSPVASAAGSAVAAESVVVPCPPATGPALDLAGEVTATPARPMSGDGPPVAAGRDRRPPAGGDRPGWEAGGTGGVARARWLPSRRRP